jgi:hypothetical protein
MPVMSSRAVGKDELRAWLSPSASLGSAAFALALLRDLYRDDADVRAWLAEARSDFHGQTAAELLRTGRAHQVETLLVRLWNSSTKTRLRRPTFLRRIEHEHA